LSAVSAACFLTCVAVILSAVRRGADPLSPVRVFGFVWALVLGLADLKFSGFQEEWSAYAWVVLLTALAAVVAGILLVDVLLLGGVSHVPIATIRRGVGGFSPANQRRYVGSLGALAGIYLVSYLVEAVSFGSVPIFSPRPDRARMEFGLFGVHLLVTLAPSVMILATQYFLVFRGKLRYRTAVLSVFVVVFVSYGFLLQRFSYVMWAVISGCFAFYFTRYINWKSLLAASGLFAGFIVFLQSIRLSRYVEDYIYVVSRMKYPRAFAPLTEPYMYTVMNLENLARGVDRLETFTAGLFTFDPFAALLGVKHAAAAYFNVVERPFLNSGYNTFPFMWTYYRDFGYAGMALICLSLGIAIGYLYNRFRSRPTLHLATAYILAVFFMSLSFFTNVLAMLNMVTNIVLLYSMNRLLFPGAPPLGAGSTDGRYPETAYAGP
jgi:oligosaccharide repeat unit polymerase